MESGTVWRCFLVRDSSLKANLFCHCWHNEISSTFLFPILPMGNRVPWKAEKKTFCIRSNLSLTQWVLIHFFDFLFFRHPRIQDPLRGEWAWESRVPRELQAVHPAGDQSPDVQRPPLPAQVERVRVLPLLQVVRGRDTNPRGQLHTRGESEAAQISCIQEVSQKQLRSSTLRSLTRRLWSSRTAKCSGSAKVPTWRFLLNFKKN